MSLWLWRDYSCLSPALLFLSSLQTLYNFLSLSLFGNTPRVTLLDWSKALTTTSSLIALLTTPSPLSLPSRGLIYDLLSDNVDHHKYCSLNSHSDFSPSSAHRLIFCHIPFLSQIRFYFLSYVLINRLLASLHSTIRFSYHQDKISLHDYYSYTHNMIDTSNVPRL